MAVQVEGPDLGVQHVLCRRNRPSCTHTQMALGGVSADRGVGVGREPEGSLGKSSLALKTAAVGPLGAAG